MQLWLLLIYFFIQEAEQEEAQLIPMRFSPMTPAPTPGLLLAQWRCLEVFMQSAYILIYQQCALNHLTSLPNKYYIHLTFTYMIQFLFFFNQKIVVNCRKHHWPQAGFPDLLSVQAKTLNMQCYHRTVCVHIHTRFNNQ